MKANKDDCTYIKEQRQVYLFVQLDLGKEQLAMCIFRVKHVDKTTVHISKSSTKFIS